MQAAKTADVTVAEAQPAGEVEDGKLRKAEGAMVDTARKKAEDEAGEKAEISRAQKAEIKADKDAAAAKKTAEKVEQAAKKQAAAIKKADQETSKKAEKHAAAAKKAAYQAAKKQAAADEKADAKAKKRADADEAKANKQSEKQAAAEKKAADEKDDAIDEYWRTVDMEYALGEVQTFFRFLADDTGSQNILLLQRHSVLRWRYNSALSRCLAMLTSARHQKATTATTKLACCLAALTSAAGATDGADTILAVRDLSSRCCRQWYNTVAPWWQTVHKDDLHWSAHCLSYFMDN